MPASRTSPKPAATPRPRSAAVQSPPPPPRINLTIDSIVEAAVRSIQKVGLAGLSMRQLAGVLEVTPTAIYHHVSDKDALLDLCAEAILAQIPPPDAQLPWPQQLRTLILEQQRTFMRYPGLARFLLIHRESSVAALSWAEAILGVLHPAGFHGAQAMRVLMTLSFLVNPITLIDDKVHSKKTNPVLNRTRVSSLIRKHPGKLPHFAAVLPHLEGISYESHFAVALDRVIAGIEREVRD
jgi:AcrR family transcriptional regulator